MRKSSISIVVMVVLFSGAIHSVPSQAEQAPRLNEPQPQSISEMDPVVVTASRQEESWMESPYMVEKLTE